MHQNNSPAASSAFSISNSRGRPIDFVFLRSDAAFWRRSSVAALVFAVLATADSVAVIFAPRSVFGQIGFVGLLGGPMLALAFCLSGVFSPNRVSRTRLFAARITEGAAFAAWGIACLVRNS